MLTKVYLNDKLGTVVTLEVDDDQFMITATAITTALQQPPSNGTFVSGYTETGMFTVIPARSILFVGIVGGTRPENPDAP